MGSMILDSEIFFRRIKLKIITNKIRNINGISRRYIMKSKCWLIIQISYGLSSMLKINGVNIMSK